MQTIHLSPAGALSRRRLLGALPPLALLASAAPSFAQAAWPQRPVKFIVPNAPGSSVDTISRFLGNAMAQTLPQPVVVDNKAGAAGALGTEVGRTAPPDGYTLIIASSSSITIAPLLQKAVPYDPLKDFDFVSMIALLPNVLVVNPALPVRNVTELVAYAKSKGNKSNMASAGVGSTSHLAGVALQVAGGFESLHVPYKGGAQGVASVVSGETDWVLTPAPAAMGLVQQGRLRLLGHSMSTEARPLGDVPAIAQTLPGFEFVGWIGLMAPKGVPAAAGDTLRRAMAQALQQPELRKSFDSNGAVPTTSTPAEFRAFLVKDIEQHKKAIEVAGVKPE
ncbi:MAG: tripartite tricarboxylate transporter substrate binding protein [Burkholderiaceae bacterium]|nr:tripartite tricarboxylate transporter substrate binding protein [Burkholderiaceae bacterium]